MTVTTSDRLARIFVELADTLVDEFDLIEFLQMVTGHISSIADATAAGLLLADHHGDLHLMAATDERAHMLELFQVQKVEGPCQDCFTGGRTVSNTDLREADGLWPQFAPRAVSAGFLSVHAVPLRLRSEVIGALNLFGSEADALTDVDAPLVQALADVATIGLLHERAVRRAETLTEQLQAALNSRIVLEQAKGALAQIHGATPDEAFEKLRVYSRARRLRLTEVAQALLADPASVPDLTVPDGEQPARRDES
jgi:transcriptional regulator with GAF, ATPase, and Fis domain